MNYLRLFGVTNIICCVKAQSVFGFNSCLLNFSRFPEKKKKEKKNENPFFT